MAETAIGAIGLLALYSFCHEVFEDVQFARNCGTDYDRYQARLDLINVKFTRWGASLALDTADSSRPQEIQRIAEETRTKDEETHTIKSILEQILITFDKCRKKSKPYQKSDDAPPCDPENDLSPAFKVSHRVFNKICRRRTPQQPSAEQQARQIGSWKRAKWALHDRERIGGLITDLGDLVNELVELFPPHDPQAAPRLAGQEVQELCQSLSDAQIDDTDSQEALSSLGEMAATTDDVLAPILENVVAQARSGYRLRDQVHDGNALTVYGDAVSNEAVGKVKLEGNKFYDSARAQHKGSSFTVYGNMHGMPAKE